MSPAQQLTLFISKQFDQEDLVEIRAIKNLPDGSTSVVKQSWQTACATQLLHNSLRRLNRNGVNIYFGVNPRVERQGSKRAIHCCRSVWVDLDDLSIDEAKRRWSGVLPEPSMMISSGHGIHAYWKLTEPVDVQSDDSRRCFESMLKSLYAELGADSTQDVSRLLRLPGLDNVKSTPIPCELIHSGGPTVPLSTFNRWFAAGDSRAAAESSPTVLEKATLPTTADVTPRMRRVIASLDQSSDDRSRRDFAVVCKLLRLGLSPAEIKSLVAGRSKFTTTTYLDITIENAVAAVFGKT
ncbi:hypothetical protein V7x_40960 [Crateriforma conspicua]|uniref:RepB-like DNA primase domain-containing protein n=1 Tax=Crateriforma conspicua TaxID=2527996 RepID=A0A5C6FK59_9PLAN|nr:DNA-primase RepB domain-containing protein [Crateriforma conspicua]TWU62367.1 hypothetical protein V7x_40960 [Crateriforma conspicua]